MTATYSQEGLTERTFEHKWVIKNWRDVVEKDDLAENTKAEFQLKAENIIYANVLVGTAIGVGCIGFYWELLYKHQCMEKVDANLAMEILDWEQRVVYKFETQEDAVVGTKMVITKSWWSRTRNSELAYATYTNAEGSLEVKLKFALKNLPDLVSLSNVEDFRTTYKDEFCRNFAALLNDKLSSDVKIVTKDKFEFFVHKIILRAQCPVFASMFGSNFMEGRSGVVKVDDISSKTMKILLNCWYTGELLPSWKDNDTVVEFIYAAGKYQMMKVLKMLDTILGLGGTTSDVDVELLKMTNNLSLKFAEARLLKRVNHKISQATNGTELLTWFSLTTDIINEEEYSAAQIAKAWNDAINENDDRDAICQDVKLLALACKLGLKNIENNLLKRIIATVSKLSSAEELFELFDLPHDQLVHVSVSDESTPADLLVRVNPN